MYSPVSEEFPSKVRKIGNSYYVNIPSRIANKLRLRVGEYVLVRIRQIGEEI